MKLLTDAELFEPVTRIALSMDALERLLKAETQAAASSGSLNPYGLLDLSADEMRIAQPPAT